MLPPWKQSFVLVPFVLLLFGCCRQLWFVIGVILIGAVSIGVVILIGFVVSFCAGILSVVIVPFGLFSVVIYIFISFIVCIPCVVI